MENPVPYQQQQPQHAASATASTHPLFEFTKRKKWDHLLLQELHLSISLILSPTANATILSAGHNHALHAILGYPDDDILDSDFADLVVDQDLHLWQTVVADALSGKSGPAIALFLRLKRNPSKASPTLYSTWPSVPASNSIEDVLFELRGHVHYFTNNNSPRTSSS